MAKKTAREILNEAFADYKEAEDIGKMDKIFENTLKQLRRILIPKKKNPEFWKRGYAAGWNDCRKAVRRGLK